MKIHELVSELIGNTWTHIGMLSMQANLSLQNEEANVDTI
jgi:hypothetical protein